MSYPGLAYIGNGNISGLYGLNETIHDQKSIGLQHLYVDEYDNDLIYSATTVVTLEDACYFGDRIKPLKGHPVKKKSDKSLCRQGFNFIDRFSYEKISKTDSVYCADDYKLSFTCQVENTSKETLSIELSALLISNKKNIQVHKEGEAVYLFINGKRLCLRSFEEKNICRLSLEAPSGFMYHGIQDILYDENRWDGETVVSCEAVAISVSTSIVLAPGESYLFKWMLDFSKDGFCDSFLGEKEARDYWDKWLAKSDLDLDKEMKASLIALKAVNMNGFLPADLTGHYFASDDVAFYVRDALLGARAFLFCGFYEECRAVVKLVMNLKRKDNYELFQRYNSELISDEGANNNVFSQIDVIGYLLSLVVDFYEMTGTLLVEPADLMKEVNILDSVKTKNGLYGPEGGVNEGVYGPAYITSTNIMIASGLNQLLKLDQIRSDLKDAFNDVKERLEQLVNSINGTFMKEEYFAYGYVDYHDQLVRRYDTPQLFGAGLGYPLNEQYKMSFQTLTEIATYFQYGYGYSEQEYHDGPWLFNTCFAAQNAYLLGDRELYENIIKWIENHKNDYSLLPEAIDARDETNSFINPLMWANAEYLCAKQAPVIKRLREGESV